MDLDMWLDALMNAAGNQRVNRGGPGYVDASVGIPKLEVPHEQITGASGDIHVYGNPHYFYDPVTARSSRTTSRWAWTASRRATPPYFNANYKRFADRD